MIPQNKETNNNGYNGQLMYGISRLSNAMLYRVDNAIQNVLFVIILKDNSDVPRLILALIILNSSLISTASGPFY